MEKERFKKLIYVCSKYRGEIEKNKANAGRYCKIVCQQGYIPIAPHIYFTKFLNDNYPRERSIGLKMGLQLLKLCSEIWVFGEDISEGMAMEIKCAKDNKIPVKYFNIEKGDFNTNGIANK